MKARVVRHQGTRFRFAPLPKHIAYLKRDGVTRDGADVDLQAAVIPAFHLPKRPTNAVAAKQPSQGEAVVKEQPTSNRRAKDDRRQAPPAVPAQADMFAPPAKKLPEDVVAMKGEAPLTDAAKEAAAVAAAKKKARRLAIVSWRGRHSRDRR